MVQGKTLGGGDPNQFNTSGVQGSVAGYPTYTSQTTMPSGAALTRWGDYASMTVDPADDCTFWFTTEAYDAVGYDWRTKIASFSLPGCTGGGTAPTSPSTGEWPSSCFSAPS